MQVNVMSLPGTIAVCRTFAMTQDSFHPNGILVMPANAGVHGDSLQEGDSKMDSGLRRNDRAKIQLQIGASLGPRLRAEVRFTRLQGST